MSITLENLLPIQDDRDELVQLLNVIGTEWHEHEEAFEHRTLAEWPKWCEEQGFRFEVLHNLACNLEHALNDPEGSEGIKQCIAALGPAATAPQLLLSLSQQLPQFLEAFDQLLQISQEESQALGSQAGGTAKQWIKDHPVVDAIGAGLAYTGTSSVVIGLTYVLRKRFLRARQKAENVGRERVDRAEEGLIRDSESEGSTISVDSFYSELPDDIRELGLNLPTRGFERKVQILLSKRILSGEYQHMTDDLESLSRISPLFSQIESEVKTEEVEVESVVTDKVESLVDSFVTEATHKAG